MTLIVTRAKIFRVQEKGITKRVQIEPRPQPQIVDDWVRDTLGFKLGIQDGSISEIEIKSPAPTVTQASAPEMSPGGLMDPGKQEVAAPQPVAVEVKTDTTDTGKAKK